jgi:hypothetical protein
MEFPEDLGAVASGQWAGVRPGSLWQWPEHQDLVDDGWTSLGLRQQDFGMPYFKPTRLLLRLGKLAAATFFVGVPEFCVYGFCLGPIPKAAPPSLTLARKAGGKAFGLPAQQPGHQHCVNGWWSQLSCRTLMPAMTLLARGMDRRLVMPLPQSLRGCLRLALHRCLRRFTGWVALALLGRPHTLAR